MFRSAKWALFLCILGFGGSSCLAAIIESNDPRYPGTANTTIDTATKLEWLDWSVAKTPPPIPELDWDIESHLKPGGLYEGWRLASYAELSRLLGDVGLGLPPISGGTVPIWTADWDPIPLAALDPFVYSVPAPKPADRNNRNYGACVGGRLNFNANGQRDGIGYVSSLSIDYFFSGGFRFCGHGVGYMLVRTAHPVPEPSGLAMLCFIAPALLRTVRRRWKLAGASRAPAPTHGPRN